MPGDVIFMQREGGELSVCGVNAHPENPGPQPTIHAPSLT